MTTRILKTQTSGKRWPTVALHCPSCRSTQRCKPVGTATVSGVRKEVVECQGHGCGLIWVPSRSSIPKAA
jgi:hypothetical protein